MRRIILINFLFLITHFASAQFTDSTNQLLHLTGTGMINQSEESNYFILNSVFKYSVRKKSVVLNEVSSIMYGKQEEKLLNNDYSFSLDFNLYKTWPGFYYWGLGTFDKSYSLKLNSRFQVGAGAAYNLWDRKNFFFNLSDGIIYEQSHLDIADGNTQSVETIRNSLRVKLRYTYKEIITLEGTHFFQPSMTIKRDYIIKSTTSLLFRIRSGIFLNASVNYNRLNYTNSENLLLSFGVTMERYF